MNNEEKILQMLTTLTDKVTTLEQGQENLRQDVITIKSDVADIKSNLDYIWEDIRGIDERLTTQETKIRFAK